MEPSKFWELYAASEQKAKVRTFAGNCELAAKNKVSIKFAILDDLE